MAREAREAYYSRGPGEAMYYRRRVACRTCAYWVYSSVNADFATLPRLPRENPDSTMLSRRVIWRRPISALESSVVFAMSPRILAPLVSGGAIGRRFDVF